MNKDLSLCLTVTIIQRKFGYHQDFIVMKAIVYFPEHFLNIKLNRSPMSCDDVGDKMTYYNGP